ncbi:uncharacterized protein LOC135113255 [Scylla paramamosain]|uniref:uncharacterized protein LOC135113255 n=1 Tax=Scylla paramamosain TaxID=85552 RepID=UPI0030833E9B
MVHQVSALVVAVVMVVLAAPASSFPQQGYQNVQVSAVIVALVMVVVAAPVSSIPQNSYQNVQVSAVIVALVMVVVAAPVSSIPQNSYQNVQPSAPAQYSYNYGVNDDFGNNFGHGENRQGDNTDGAFSVVLPDGRRQSVEYSVSGDSGFLANVQYDGQAQFPQARPQYSQQAVEPVSAVIVALVMVVVAAPVSSFPQNSYQNVQPSAPAQYSYNYGVNDDFGNNFGHGENRQGDNTDGAFSVVLPDGRRQSVEYSVSGDSGFLANVQYDGQAQFPQARPQYSQQALEPVSAVIVALVMVVVAAPVSSIPQNSYQNVQPSAPAQYSYNYGVNDDFGNNFGHGENRQGDNTDGAFSVVLPDGRRQSVEYSVSGDSGFLANVQYDGQAQFPQARPQYSQQAVEPVRPQYA